MKGGEDSQSGKVQDKNIFLIIKSGGAKVKEMLMGREIRVNHRRTWSGCGSKVLQKVCLKIFLPFKTTRQYYLLLIKPFFFPPQTVVTTVNGERFRMIHSEVLLEKCFGG